MLRIIARTAGLALVLAAPLSAQTTITPFGGRIFPLRSMIIDTSGGSGSYFRMQTHSIYGLQASRTVATRVAVELSVGVGSGAMEIVAGGTPLTLGSTVYFADLHGRVKIAGTDAAQLGLVAGAGWTQYSMGLFEAAHALSDSIKFKGTVTGVVGLGFRGKVSDRFAVTADLTDRIHSQGLDAPGITGSGDIEKTQHDIAFALGLSFPLGK